MKPPSLMGRLPRSCPASSGDEFALAILGDLGRGQGARGQKSLDFFAQHLANEMSGHRLGLDRSQDMRRALVAGFARFRRQVVGADLFGRYSDAPELDGRVDLKVLAELSLERDIDKHAGRIEVAEEENDDGLLSRQVVNVIGRLVSEGPAGKPAAWIEANGELLAIGLHHTRNRAWTPPTPRTGHRNGATGRRDRGPSP